MIDWKKVSKEILGSPSDILSVKPKARKKELPTAPKAPLARQLTLTEKLKNILTGDDNVFE
jgi:hypothetical protein